MSTDSQESVILVDSQDIAIGTGEKLAVHRQGLLHRAFSIFIYNSKNELLLQKRALKKYHSAGLWSDTCSGHPRPEEDIVKAAHRRLQEEMGFDCEISETGKIKYQAELGHGFKEHEIDYIFVGHYDGPVVANPDEMDEYIWQNLKDLQENIQKNPNQYAAWLKIILAEHSNLILPLRG